MRLITQLLIGFSVFSAAILLLAYLFFLRDLKKTAVGMMSCAVLLATLCALQIAHLLHWQTGFEPVDSHVYALLLLIAPATFFLFSKEVLLPERGWTTLDLVHLVPAATGVFLAPKISVPLAFVVGAGYTLWYAQIVFAIRRNLGRFRFEALFFGLFAVIAVALLLVVIFRSSLGTAIFYLAYTHAIGWSLVLVVAVLITQPQLLGDITEAVSLTYAKTTLGDVDVEASLEKLDALMRRDKLYQDESLSLAGVADAMALSSHQLSELINRHKGSGFSRYIREQRIGEAKRLLLEEADSSVLSISLMSGFRSQSSFYTAFRESTGQTPAAYRKAARNDKKIPD